MSGIPATLADLTVPLEQLRHYSRNPRRGRVDVIAESLARNGQYRPVVANRRTGEVLAGNHTLAAAQHLGWTELAVTWVDVDEEQAARIVLVDNKASDLAQNDDATVIELLQLLPDLEGTGFYDKDLAALLADTEPVRLTDPDEAPPVNEGPTRTAPGEVWKLGPHRLAVGDSTDIDLVERLIAGDAAIDLLLTDPPYGVSYTGAGGMKVLNDELRDDKLQKLLVGAFDQAVAAMRPGAPFYIFGPSNDQQTAFRLAIAEAGLHLRAELVWVKNALVLGRSDYQPRHESVLAGHAPVGPEAEPLEHEVLFYGWKDGAAHPWNGGRRQTTVLEFPKPRKNADHPTMKPVEMLELLIRNSSEAGATILDLFAGSGSTLIAAHGTHRIARVAELFPKYADAICRRYQEHTGVMPELAGRAVDFTVPL